MSKIFISYRRADSQYVTDAIYLQLRGIFGEENVFLDVGKIPFGVDFRQYLNEQIEAHEVVLVMIGSEWSTIMKERANQTNDFVRIEIENALKLQKLVIPVLVMGARMPDFTELPASIAELQWRNSAQIRRHPDLEGDCIRLADGIKEYLSQKDKNTYSQEIDTFQPQTHADKPVIPENNSPVEESPVPISKPEVKRAEPEKIRPKEKIPTKNLLPAPFDWCEIPAGTVRIQGEIGSYIPAFTSNTYKVYPFLMSKYPVTNAQYQLFVNAGGYQNKAWWTESGWEQKETEGWQEPLYWQNPKWNTRNKPVVGISWYEAIAFCHWLWDSTGEYISLPEEQQWQRAARGDDERKFPWGNEWNSNAANHSLDKKRIAKTSSVSKYEPDGNSPFGVVDMLGNVMEWCLNHWETESLRLETKGKRVLCGASWGEHRPSHFHLYSRLWTTPDYRSYSIGFRLVRRQKR